MNGAPRRWVAAGLLAGALDIVYAIAIWSTRDVAPAVVVQAIASGVLGRAAFGLGGTSVALGLALHFAMTLAMAAAFAFAAGRLAWLSRAPLLAGAGYGVLLYVLMNGVVVPLSRAPLTGAPWPIAWANLGAHVFLVGIPIALIVAGRRARSADARALPH
ncbi:hypothetical protein ACFOED_09305 [Vulcaniibacterium thermophilum]|uniref:DUF1440 domain-containing protein n=1 Tax=Vulcaniibacterium thermophilum TaxID=1169913 RepID=A0A918Z8T7_9GAMM|nr:hypothetical protein [Vulcaniibacterium thermophilum]GHE38746.1 hypothetical protein GCM10007167_21040 [Vulcaniibacterium thermophilum]